MASPTEPTDGFSLASIRVSPNLTEEVKARPAVLRYPLITFYLAPRTQIAQSEPQFALFEVSPRCQYMKRLLNSPFDFFRGPKE